MIIQGQKHGCDTGQIREMLQKSCLKESEEHARLSSNYWAAALLEYLKERASAAKTPETKALAGRTDSIPRDITV